MFRSVERTGSTLAPSPVFLSARRIGFTSPDYGAPPLRTLPGRDKNLPFCASDV
jgi:hypothetical protein